MLYAASRASLSKGLGSGYFVDSLFATSLADLTAESYKAHLAHNAAPKPLSEREREIEEAKAAEKSAEPVYEGSRARKTHVGNPIGFQWDPKAEEAFQSFVTNQLSELIILVGLIHNRIRNQVFHIYL
jgi:twinfilin-like protein